MSYNNTPLAPQTSKGAIILNTAEGPKVFTLVMANPESISADDIFEGEAVHIAYQKGQLPSPAGAKEEVGYQSSLWRYNRSCILNAMFTTHLFTNECVFPCVTSSGVTFKLYRGDAASGSLLSPSNRKIVRQGEDVPATGSIPNVEVFLKASDFGWDGFITTVKFTEQDHTDIDFSKNSIAVEIRTMGVVLGKIPKLYMVPLHNMHSDGRWCFSTSSAVGLLKHPTVPSPGPLFSDLVSSPANGDLETENHKHILAEAIFEKETKKMPIFRLYPSGDFRPELVNCALPPVWNKITKWNK